MENLQTIIFGSVSMLTALLALFISYKAFIRNRSLENENHFFKYKLEEYQALVYEATALVDSYYNALMDMKSELESDEPDYNALDELADDVDHKTDLFRLTLQKHCAFIPKDIVHKLDQFYESLSEEFEGLERGSYTNDMFDKVWDRLEQYEAQIEEITDLMREDVGIVSIDRRLKSRTHAKHRKGITK
jgi:hypothetical protein